MTQEQALAWEPATHVDVLASAYRDEETGMLVVVAINEADQEREVELTVPHNASSLRLTSYRTAEGEALARGPVARLHRGEDGLARGTVELAPRSITTFTAPWA